MKISNVRLWFCLLLVLDIILLLQPAVTAPAQRIFVLVLYSPRNNSTPNGISQCTVKTSVRQHSKYLDLWRVPLRAQSTMKLTDDGL
jgi:hypothetical protein